MKKRISLPIQSVNGTLKMVEDDESDIQSLKHHIDTLPATHSLTRLLGVEIQYHVTAATALQSIFDLRMNMYRYESNDIISDITAEFVEEMTLKVVFKWKSVYTLGGIQNGER